MGQRAGEHEGVYRTAEGRGDPQGLLWNLQLHQPTLQLDCLKAHMACDMAFMGRWTQLHLLGFYRADYVAMEGEKGEKRGPRQREGVHCMAER